MRRVVTPKSEFDSNQNKKTTLASFKHSREENNDRRNNSSKKIGGRRQRLYSQIKNSLETSEKSFTTGMDKLIANIEKAENDILKQNREEQKTMNSTTSNDTEKQAAKNAIEDNETVVQAASFYQSTMGSYKEYGIQAFSALLQATKDACTQAKEIAVKVIGLNKKMTESANYSSYNESATFGGDFISAVKLV